MDITPVVTALIGGVAIVLAAVLPVLIQRRASPDLSPDRVHRRQRITIFSLLCIAVVGLGYSVVTTLFSVTEYSCFASDFTPARVERNLSNAFGRFFINKDQTLKLSTLPWYKFKLDDPKTGRGSVLPSDLSYMNLPIKCYLLHESHLHDTHSWTRFFLWRRKFPIQALNLMGKSELLLIVHALNPDDTLEIGLKDSLDNETRAEIPIKKNWAGYQIPLSEFKRHTKLEINKITMFKLAHSKLASSIDYNTFKIAWLGTN